MLYLIEYYRMRVKGDENSEEIHMAWVNAENRANAIEKLKKRDWNFSEVITCHEQASIVPLAMGGRHPLVIR